MTARQDYYYGQFLQHLGFQPTSCQDALFRQVASFITADEDLMLVNGYAGTGKTSAFAAIIAALQQVGVHCSLMAPTGRAAKVLSLFAHTPASTIHKKIYRQSTVSDKGWGKFTLNPNKDKDTLYIVDEASLIGIDDASARQTLFGTGDLLADLLTYVRSGRDCKLILIGDAAQLPPVGLDRSPSLSPEVMTMMGATAFSTLSSVVRQQQDSGILHNATLVRQCITEENPSMRIRLELEGYPDIERIGGGELIDCLTEAYSRYGEDETIILCRSNKRANRYNAGVRAMVQFKEERLVRGDRLMIVKNNYKYASGLEASDYIANGDMAKLLSISRFEERYGLHFATARLSLPDYDDAEIRAKVILDTLESEQASLGAAMQEQLYQGVYADYAQVYTTKKKIYECVREDDYFNALQLKYAYAITTHKSQGGQWACVFIDNPFWQEEQTLDDLKWLYTALTRATQKIYLVNFKDSFFQ
ncbi:MAG: AAA family ATPase [Bacteroidales bacterium]|nr:AAA family ATPase [Bacteroidales bacterium]